MDIRLQETAAGHDPLLVCAFAAKSQSHSHKGLFLKVFACMILVLFLFSASFVAFCGAFCNQNEYQSSVQKCRSHFSSQYLNVRNRLSTAYLNIYPKIMDLAFTGAHAQHFVDYLMELLNFHGSEANLVKPNHLVNAFVTVGAVQPPGLKADISIKSSAASKVVLRGARRSYASLRAELSSLLKIVQDLTHEGLLHHHFRVLCLDPSAGRKVLALKKRGFKRVEGIDISPTLSISNQGDRNTLQDVIVDQSFDFAFTSYFDHTSEPALFVAEIERSLKVGGFAAMHVSLSVWREKYMTSKPGTRVKPVTLLFKTSEIVYVSTAYASCLDTLIVFKKMSHADKETGAGQAELERKQPLSVSQQVVHRSRSLRISEFKRNANEHHAPEGV